MLDDIQEAIAGAWANRCRASRKTTGCEFIGWVGEFKGESTRVVMKCPAHGIWKTTRASNIHLGGGCPSCKTELHTYRRRMKDNDYTESLISCGKIKPWMSIERIGVKKFLFKCERCEVDRFASLGCEKSWVIGNPHNRGCACRCSSKRRWSEKELEVLSESGGSKFIQWVDQTPLKKGGNNHWKVRLECAEHGQYTTSIGTVRNGSKCPGCAKSGFNSSAEGFVYLLISDDNNHMKIGITSSMRSRMAKLKSKTPFRFIHALTIAGTGKSCIKLESMTLADFTRAKFKGFDGATEWLIFDSTIFEYLETCALSLDMVLTKRNLPAKVA